MKVAPYLALGQFSTATLATAALLPLAVPTNLAGIRLVRVSRSRCSTGSRPGWCW
ncbi:MAG TPA: hypothetical protein VKX28_00385 [Xanthobacteraceae bacterium]|nr:hypothetical protein [Xanthobacteraceae bacterium]